MKLHNRNLMLNIIIVQVQSPIKLPKSDVLVMPLVTVCFKKLFLVNSSTYKTFHTSLNRHFWHWVTSVIQFSSIFLMKSLTQRMTNWLLLLISRIHPPGDVHLGWIWSRSWTGAGDRSRSLSMTRIWSTWLDGDCHHALLLLFARIR